MFKNATMPIVDAQPRFICPKNQSQSTPNTAAPLRHSRQSCPGNLTVSPSLGSSSCCSRVVAGTPNLDLQAADWKTDSSIAAAAAVVAAVAAVADSGLRQGGFWTNAVRLKKQHQSLLDRAGQRAANHRYRAPDRPGSRDGRMKWGGLIL